MPNYNGIITNLVAGDNFTIERTVTSVPSGSLITKAWLTIKNKLSQSDAQAIIQKIITTSFDEDLGYIEDDGSSGTAHMYFYLSSTDTALLYPLSDYQYDVQVQLDSGSISTPELGIITAFPQVTIST